MFTKVGPKTTVADVVPTLLVWKCWKIENVKGQEEYCVVLKYIIVVNFGSIVGFSDNFVKTVLHLKESFKTNELLLWSPHTMHWSPS